MPLPELNLPGTQDQPNPVESLPAPNGMGASLTVGLGKTLGVSLEGVVIGGARGALGTPQQQAFVPYDDAKAEMEQDGYDPHVLPKAGLTRGELDTIVSQQSAIKQNEAIASQSHLGNAWKGVAQFAGGAMDPLFLAAGPVIGRLGLAARGMTAVGRVGAGAVEGGVLNGAYDVGLQHFGNAPGDRDIGTQQIVQDAAVGGIVGSVLHGAFGPRKAPLAENLARLEDHKTFLQDNFPGIQITSGLRSAQHNAAIGGALRSMHLSGEAVDFVLPRDMTADQAKSLIQSKGLPITEWLIEKKGDPHSTGDHIHWGWGEKGREHFGTAPPEFERPNLISQDWTQVASPEDAEELASHALSAAATDSEVKAESFLSGLGLKAALANRGSLGETSPIWYNTRPAGLDERYMTRFGGESEPVGNRVFDEDYMRRFGGESEPLPMQGHIPLDWQEHLPELEQRGPASLVSMRDTIMRARARGILPDVPQGATPEILADVLHGLKQRFGIGTPYGPRPPAIPVPRERPPSVEPGSLFTQTAETPKPGETPPPASLSAEAAALQQHTDSAIQEAEAAHGLIAKQEPVEGQPTPVETEIANTEDALHNDGHSPEMVKAIQAAARCAAVRGLD